MFFSHSSASRLSEDYDSTVYFVPATWSPKKRRQKRKRPGIVIPESAKSGTSSDSAANDPLGPTEEPKLVEKPKKQVRFKTSSSESEDGNLQLIQVSQRRFHRPAMLSDSSSDSENQQTVNHPSMLTVSSSDSESVQIPNAQKCKYGQAGSLSDNGEDANDEDSSNEKHFAPVTSEGNDNTTSQDNIDGIEPTPVPPEGFSQPEQHVGGPTTSTPKESTTGLYSLVANQPKLSTL